MDKHTLPTLAATLNDVFNTIRTSNTAQNRRLLEAVHRAAELAIEAAADELESEAMWRGWDAAATIRRLLPAPERG